MNRGRQNKVWLLGVVVLGVLGLAWHRFRVPVSESPKSQHDQPRVQTTERASAPASSVAIVKPSNRTPESMADEAYRACVLTNQVKREELLLALVVEMTPENARPLLEELMRGNRTPIKPGQTVWNAFWRKWGAVDGKACLEELISRGQQNRISTDGVLAMEAWAAADPQAAAEWLKVEQPSVPLWNAAWATFQITSQGENALSATPEILQAADTPSKMDAACQQLADLAQLQKGAEGLLAWFDSVPNDARAGAVNHFLYRLITSDPQSAVNFMTKNAQSPWRDDRHAGKLINEISKQDPSGTATWAAQLYPSPQGTPLELTPIFQATLHWAKSDPAMAKSWLETNAQQPWADTAKAGYSKGAPSE